MQITLGLPEPREYTSLPRLRLVQNGIKRVHAAKTPLSVKVRLPITPGILRKIYTLWSTTKLEIDVKMFWAACTLCFFGFFRSGEITVPTERSFNSKMHLSWGDVRLDKQKDPTMIQVFVKKSKTDQFGKGANVFLGMTGCCLCPVAAVTSYMASRGTKGGPFFMLQNGTPLTKTKFVGEVRAALEMLGLPAKDFAGHSFRIGAATAAAKAGLEDSTIRTLGRWNSSAFLAYIRSSPSHLAQLSPQIAKC